MKKYLFAASLLLAMTSCGNQEGDTLKAENDELKKELEISRQTNETLEEVGSMLDSIETSRNMLKVELESGTSYDDYKAKVAALDNYLKESDRKIAELEKAIEESGTQNKVYAATISRLKKQLSAREGEIATLNQQVEKYKNENQALIKTTELQSQELSDREALIAKKKEELSQLETKIEEMMKQAKKTEADAYYAQAEAYEEAADRTKLAPRKKRETYQQALELYKKAFEGGKQDAMSKIEALEKKVK